MLWICEDASNIIAEPGHDHQDDQGNREMNHQDSTDTQTEDETLVNGGVMDQVSGGALCCCCEI